MALGYTRYFSDMNQKALVAKHREHTEKKTNHKLVSKASRLSKLPDSLHYSVTGITAVSFKCFLVSYQEGVFTKCMVM